MDSSDCGMAMLKLLKFDLRSVIGRLNTGDGDYESNVLEAIVKRREFGDLNRAWECLTGWLRPLVPHVEIHLMTTLAT